MENISLAKDITNINFDLDYFVSLALESSEVRNELIYLVTLFGKKGDINLYYHAYYIIDKASKIKPEIFYEYWNVFEKLLNHPNSYHRNIGHWILTNLVKCDEENKFGFIFDKYINLIHDEKFLTANYCVQDCHSLIDYRPDYIDKITEKYLNIDEESHYSKKQIELLKYEILCFFERVYLHSRKQKNIQIFILKCKNSVSPKTRKKALELINKDSILMHS